MLTLIALGIGGFVLLCLLMYVRQDRLLFFPRPNDPALRAQWQYQRIEIASGEHVLEGWWAEGAEPDATSVVLYFGGNAEDVLYSAGNAAQLPIKRMLVVNYRGYGATTGRPSQDALYEDALAVYDYAIGAGGADPRDIIVMGRSLGSGVATMLAAKRRVRAAVLITPFDSIAAVAAHHYSWVPVSRLLRHPFLSIDHARRASSPALFLIAARDGVIPPIHGQRLAQAWAGETRVHVLDSVGHNDIDRHPRYRAYLEEFLQGVSRDGISDMQQATP